MSREPLRVTETASAGLGVGAQQDLTWRARWRAELYTGKHWKNPDGSLNAPDRIVETQGNLLVYGGASLMWEYAMGNGSTSISSAKKYINATGALGVGNSTVAAVNTQKVLSGGSQLVKALTGGFPTHTTGSTVAGAAQVVYKSTFGLTEGNFAWQEFGLFNKAATTASQRMLTRKVQNLLTKTSAATATFTLTLTLA
jgi:hypothetical protein